MTETELVEQLEGLERDNKRLKGFAVGVLALVAALGGVYARQPVPQTIAAHEFDMVDEEGKVSGIIRGFVVPPTHASPILGFSPGARGLQFTDPSMSHQAVLSFESGGAVHLMLLGAGPNPKSDTQVSTVSMGVDADARPSILLSDAKGEVFEGMGVNPDGSPSILLRDVKGLPRASVGFSADGSANFMLFGRLGLPGAAMSISGDGSPDIKLTSLPQRLEMRLPLWLRVNSDGSPSVSLTDAEGFTLDLGHSSTVTSQTGEKHQTSAASITMFGNDKDHHVIWKAP